MNTRMTLVLASVLTGASCLVAAGPVEPPAGPVGPTMKTLDEIEPAIPIGPDTTPGDEDSMYKITSSGRYYLTGNIIATEAGKRVIEVQASASIDLNGYVIKAANHDVGTLIWSNGLSKQRVHNGIIEPGAGGGGIDFGTSYFCVFEDLYINYGQFGIKTGRNAIVRNCRIRRSLERGIVAGNNAIIDSCTVWDSPYDGSIGIYCEDSALVTNCTVDRYDLAGIRVGDAGRIVDSTVRECRFAGIIANEDNRISGTTVTLNRGYGMYTFAGCQIEDCIVSLNESHGLLIDSASVVRRNTIRSNGTAQGDGIRTRLGANRIEDNLIVDNTGYGIYMGGVDSLIVRNVMSNNGINRHNGLDSVNFVGPTEQPGSTANGPNANYNGQ